jgi:MFS family permease
VLGRVTSRLSTNAVLGAGGTLYAVALAMVILAPGFPSALVVLVLSGIAWMAVTSTLQAELQLVLPGWVRARAFAVYTVTFMGSQTVGALIWGLAAERAGLEPAVLGAVAVVLAGVVAGAFWRVPETGHLDPSPAAYWGAPRVVVEPDPDNGPVLVAVHYTVAPEREVAFLEAMSRLRRSRQRTGASRWELYRDGERPDHFVELFRVPSWEEHLRQHDGRLTGTDRLVEEAALAFSDPPAKGDHLFPP